MDVMIKAMLERRITEKLCIIGLLLLAKWMPNSSWFHKELVCVCTCVSVCVYMYIYIYIHMHTYLPHDMLLVLQLVLKQLKFSRQD